VTIPLLFWVNNVALFTIGSLIKWTYRHNYGLDMPQLFMQTIECKLQWISVAVTSVYGYARGTIVYHPFEFTDPFEFTAFTNLPPCVTLNYVSYLQTKEDDMLRYKLDRIPFLEEKVRKVRENGKIICLDINQLMLSQENRFAFTMEVAEEANVYLEKNRHEYGLKKPILHVLSDRMNEAGFSRPEGYLYPYPIKPGPYFIKEEGN
jgi:hypothetical protein